VFYGFLNCEKIADR